MREVEDIDDLNGLLWTQTFKGVRHIACRGIVAIAKASCQDENHG